MIRRKGRSEGRKRAGKTPPKAKIDGDAIAAKHLGIGKRGLEGFFPGGSGYHANKPVNLQFLDRFEENTFRALAAGYAIWNASDATPTTRDNRMQRLKYGFVAWIKFRGKPPPRLVEIDEASMRKFAKWLGDPASKGFIADRKTRLQTLRAIEEPLARLSSSETWSTKLSPDWRRLVDPFGPAAVERKRSSRPRAGNKKIMERSTYDTLWDEAACRVEADMVEFEPLLDEMDRLERVPIELDGATAANPAALATWLLRAHPDGVPSYGMLGKRDAYRGIVSRAQHEAAEAILHPDLRVILPFIYLTIAFFALNVSVALSMTLHDYRIDEVPGGSDRLRIFPDKPRADGRQRHAVAQTPDAANPATFLPYLERRTERLRRSAPAAIRRMVFLHFDSGRKRAPKVLLKSGSTLRRALREFSNARHVGYVALSSLRITTLDVVHDITEGNIVETTAFANHRSVSTTHTDYRTEAMRLRYEESQGDALEEWERFWSSDGKVDVIAKGGRLDRTAATPGYVCRDPHSSPVPGEAGRLCRAYGHCPACELAVVPHRSPHAFRCLLGLLERLEEAEREMPGNAYVSRWPEKKFKLVFEHLPLFDDDVREAAEYVLVPPMPKLD